VPGRAPHVLILGASGFLGANVAHALTTADTGTDGRLLVLHGSTSSPGAFEAEARTVQADLTDEHAVDDLIAEVRGAVPLAEEVLVINCAALADIDRCEAEPGLAERLNRDLPQRLARRCAEGGLRLVHVSTDAVFDGRGGPYAEHHPTSPTSIYGRTKAQGEAQVLDALPTALVARTNIVGWSPSGRRSLLEYFHDRLERGEPAPGFTDILFRPLPVHWFWPTCAALLRAGSTGLRHVTGPELLSKQAFGVRVARTFDFDETLVIPASGLDGRGAPRAPSLDVLPSRLPDDRWPAGGQGRPGLDGGLAELRTAAAAGFRASIAGR
jgi:dTDP-4-dehydrorhamnose reductase